MTLVAARPASVRRTSPVVGAGRLLGLAGWAAALAVLAAGCAGSAKVPLSARPHDRDSGRALARTIAGSAACGGFEDYRVTAADGWEFTCQKGADLYVVRATSTRALRDPAIRGLADAGVPYKTGQYFVVWPFQNPGARSAPAILSSFPGELHNSR